MGEITISIEEYKQLLEEHARVKAFSDFVNSEEFSISRKTCGIFLGFEVVPGDGD